VWAIARLGLSKHTLVEGFVLPHSTVSCTCIRADRWRPHAFFRLRLRPRRFPVEDDASGSASATGAALTDGADRELRILRRTSLSRTSDVQMT